jgi:short-subunit dehydrogenase
MTADAELDDSTRVDLSRFSLAGKVAVITGASKNIGAAIARGFAEAGADLLLVARGQQALESFAAGLRVETGRRVETFVADVSEPGAAAAIVEFANRARRMLVINIVSGSGFLPTPSFCRWRR